MRLKFKTKAKGSWSAAKRSAVKAAGQWAVRKLDLRTLPITVTIRMVGGNSDTYGSCSMLDSQNFCVWLHSDYSISRTISTLFHELTHVQQHVYEGLRLDDVTRAKYAGHYYNLPTAEYWNCPWEVEARASERKLMEKYYGEKVCKR